MSRRSSTSSDNGPTRTPTNDAVTDPEKGEAPVPRGRPTPFTHSLGDPEIAGPVAGFKKGLIGGLVITMLAVLPVLSIYWGAFWRAPQHAHNLDIAVIDLDGGAVGQAVRALFTSPQVTGRNVQLSYVIAAQGEFADAEAAKHHVLDEKAWGAVVVASGASQDLQNAITSRSTTYNATNVITLFITTARNENAVPRLITPQVTPALEKFVEQFAETNARNIAGTADLGGLLSTAPALITRPVGWHTEDLRPFDIPVAAAVDFVGLIYLLVISFVVAMLNFGVRTGTGLNTLLNLRSLLIIRFAVPFILYFFMSWIYSFVSLAFQVPFSRYYGDGGFVLYWISSFLGMTALGLAVEALITVLTPRFIPYFLLLWIITNVSVAFFPIQVLPGIFRYGYAMPFYNVGQIVRTLLFDTKNHLGRNYGILIAWTALSCGTMALLTIIMRRKEMRDATAAASARPAQ